MQITREQLIAAVEAGIDASSKLSDAQIEALRTVAKNTPAVMASEYFDGCGCPATQAGLTAPNDTEYGIPSEAVMFAHAFDGFIAHEVTPLDGPTLLEVA